MSVIHATVSSHHLRPGRRDGRLRQAERCPGPGGVRHAHPARQGDHLGRAARRRCPGVRRRGLRRSQPPQRPPPSSCASTSPA